MSAPVPDQVEAVVTLTWTVPISATAAQLDATPRWGTSRAEVLERVAAQAVALSLRLGGVPPGRHGPGGTEIPTATLVNVDVQALP